MKYFRTEKTGDFNHILSNLIISPRTDAKSVTGSFFIDKIRSDQMR